jgi:hypothetical protein
MTWKSQNIINIYANRFRTEWTNTDLRVRLGEMMFSFDDPARKKLVVEERVGVTMTWLTAKELRDQLDLLITKYEAANGEILDGEVISTKSTDTTEEMIEPVGELPSEEESDYVTPAAPGDGVTPAG